MNPLIPIIAQYGLEFAIELTRLLQSKPIPTPEDFEQLKTLYGTKTWSQYVDEAKARLPKPAPVTPPANESER